MASFHKVIKLLKFKSAVNLHCFQWEAQSSERNSVAKSHSIALSIAPSIESNANSLQI